MRVLESELKAATCDIGCGRTNLSKYKPFCNRATCDSEAFVSLQIPGPKPTVNPSSTSLDTDRRFTWSPGQQCTLQKEPMRPLPIQDTLRPSATRTTLPGVGDSICPPKAERSEHRWRVAPESMIQSPWVPSMDRAKSDDLWVRWHFRVDRTSER